jgi:hypothetical protein
MFNELTCEFQKECTILVKANRETDDSKSWVIFPVLAKGAELP